MNQSFFVSIIYQLRFLNRWNLMRNVEKENVAEHLFSVSWIAHLLISIGKVYFKKQDLPDANFVAMVAAASDISEALISDIPSPTKYASEEMREQCRILEREAEEKIICMLPKELQSIYFPIITANNLVVKRYVKAADTLDAYLKCCMELKYGNPEFKVAKEKLYKKLMGYRMEEVNYFLDVFAPALERTLDEYVNAKENGEQIEMSI